MAFVPNVGGLPLVASNKERSVSRREGARWRMSRPESEHSRTRRDVLISAFGAVAAAISGDFLPAEGAMYAADVKGDGYSTSGDPNKIETYMPQIQAGYDALVDLDSNWKARTQTYDGDVVRRVLGTVGVTSPLFNIRKTFFKAWQLASVSPELDDATIEDMDSEWNLVLDGISSVDFQLYSVSFTELEESKDKLIALGRVALQGTISHYKSFLDGLKKAI